MSQAHDYLRQVLGGSPTGEVVHPWHAVNEAFHEVMEDHSPESETLLNRFLLFDGEIALEASGPRPHALSPEDHLRILAMQTLAAWDLEKHRDAINQAVGLAESDVVEDIARAMLG